LRLRSLYSKIRSAPVTLWNLYVFPLDPDRTTLPSAFAWRTDEMDGQFPRPWGPLRENHLSELGMPREAGKLQLGGYALQMWKLGDTGERKA
jgi:hypothetical protein